jgi:preprotein translocase subunit SecA
MSILNSVIKIFVGDKQQKDLKILRPIVEKVSASKPLYLKYLMMN